MGNGENDKKIGRQKTVTRHTLL